MKRSQWFEIHDWKRCPATVRNALTNFLQISIDLLDTYGPIRSRLLKAIEESGSIAVVDLCSGAGGPWPKWKRKGLTNLPITLTDKFPNQTAVQSINSSFDGTLQFHPGSADATALDTGLPGFRTIFTAFHHFSPAQGKAIIDDAVKNEQGIGIFEFTNRGLGRTLGMVLTPLAVWLLTPWMKNNSWRALTLTYLLPVIPFVAYVDGVLSCLRSYTADELRSLAVSADYRWTAGVEGRITYLVGVPLKARLSETSQRA